MFERLQKKWKVSGTQLVLILCTFAVTGSLTAYISRGITAWLGWDATVWWVWRWLLKISILLFGYQVIILAVGFCFGQFQFFWNYEKKIWRRMLGKKTPKPLYLAIFASGTGLNAQKIIDHFRNSTRVKVDLIVCNNPAAGVLDIAKKEGISILMLEKDRFFTGDAYGELLKNKKIDFIALAGFLWKIPAPLLLQYPNKIVNIHPALLPKHGGKGMYGQKVHQAVLEAGESESGITIHYVNDQYDAGQIIFRQSCIVSNNDTPATLAQKVQELEHRHYSEVLEQLLLSEPKPLP
jgi:formyltetrahydrofolate-dependent phosphoribosylglycinamide formyltransferase